MEDGVANAQVFHEAMECWDTSLFLSSSLTSCHIQLQKQPMCMHLCALLSSYMRAHAIFTQQASFFARFFNLQSSEFVHIHPTRKLTIASKKHQGPKNSTVTILYVANPIQSIHVWYLHSFYFDGKCTVPRSIPFRELTYPTWEKGKSSSKCHFLGDMLVPWRVYQSHWVRKLGNDFWDFSRKFSAQQKNNPKTEETTEFHLAPQRLGKSNVIFYGTRSW